MINLIPVDEVQQEQILRVLERTQSYENFVSLLKAAEFLSDQYGGDRTDFEKAVSRRFKAIAAVHFRRKPFAQIEQAVDECLTPGYVYSPLMEVLLEMAPTASKYLECARRYPSDVGMVACFHREIQATLGHFFDLSPTEEEMLELLHGFCLKWDRHGDHCYNPPRRQYYLDERGRTELMRRMMPHMQSAEIYRRWVTGGGCELPWSLGCSDIKRQFIRETLVEFLRVSGSEVHLPAIKESYVGERIDLSPEWDLLLKNALNDSQPISTQAV